MSMYCTLDQARDAGASGSDDEVTAAIERATDRVIRYTHELFTPETLTIVRPVSRDGAVYTHLRIGTVTAVRYVGWSTPISPGSWRYTTSETPGQTDAVLLVGALAWSDITVLGAEPWNGGWANLYLPTADVQAQVELDGTFGWDAPPGDVAEATAIIATHLRRGDKTPEGSGSATTSVDGEGNVIPVLPPLASASADVATYQRTRTRTTGSLHADELLATYLREPVRVRS